MSFNFQGPGEMPIIRGAQNMMNNGGGGNLGYFQGRQKKKEEDNLNPSIFNTDEEDSFTLSSDTKDSNEQIDKKESKSGFNAIKNFFKKFTDNKEQED